MDQKPQAGGKAQTSTETLSLCVISSLWNRPPRTEEKSHRSYTVPRCSRLRKGPETPWLTSSLRTPGPRRSKGTEE